ncbi:phosphinothricin acetyltransferase [Burkholderiales bacterium]|nr:phosphinothricin acetyltransferase [Burkholderiales bacterium]
MPGWRIRRAVPVDAPAIWAIHTRAIRETASSHYAPEAVAAWSGRMTPASYAEPIDTQVVLVAENDDGRLGGFAQLKPREGIVQACYVDPDFNRRGVGRALMAALEDEARAAGRTALLLDASVNAIAFYESLGWRQETRARHELVPGAMLDCAIMTKKIA